MSHLPIWYLGSIETDKIDEARSQFDLYPKQEAVMGIYGIHIDLSMRDTQVTFINKKNWLQDEMYAFALNGNKDAKWNYDVNGSQNLQFAEYGIKQHYNWHVDCFALSETNFDRKITVVCLLNNPSEFEGGEFQIRLHQDYTAPLIKGSIIAFPSILEHRVTPVTSGKRYTATIWVIGPKFK